MIIKVTKEHIQKGEPGVADLCAVALAIRDKCERKDVSVHAGMIWIGQRVRAQPKSVQEFIGQYDQKAPVKPFQFRMRDL